MRNVLVRKPVFPNDFRALFQTLSRLAVATSCGLGAGCSAAHHGRPEDPDPAPERDAAENEAIGETPPGMDAAVTADPTPRTDGAVSTDAAQRADTSADADASALDAAQLQEAATPLPGTWVHLACSEAGVWSFENTKLKMPVDYFAKYTPYFTAEQRKAAANGGELGLPSFGTNVLHGSACARATAPAACQSAIDQQLAATKCSLEQCPSFALVTAGDAVTRVEGPAALAALFGAIDTETEAAIVALLAGGSVNCWFEIQSDASVKESIGTRIRAVEGGYELETQSWCYGLTGTATATVASDGNVKVFSTSGICLGRRPDGLEPASPCVASTELGAYFVSATHLEAASVLAFEQLARDLTRLGAPSELVGLALASAREEVEHARTMGALAERFGGALVAAQVTPSTARDAFAIALENAVEGCVRETYGALVACYQAETALDPEVRAAMVQLFEDETRHAQLAWQLAQWIEPQLSEAERQALQRAQSAEYVQLRRELESHLSRDARLQIGLPEAAVGAAMLAQLDTALGLQAA